MNPLPNDRSVEHATIVIERRFEATPARVFAAWADPAARDRWFVKAEGWPIAEYAHDFRIGGHERGRFSASEGGEVYGNETRYLDIVPGKRIVFAYTMARDGAIISASLATVEFFADGKATRMIFTEQGAFLDLADQPKYREEGWTSLLDALARELAAT